MLVFPRLLNPVRMSGRRYFSKESGMQGNKRGRHPPHLKGREIGMFYAQRSRKKQLCPVQMDMQKEHQISNLLDTIRAESLGPGGDDGSQSGAGCSFGPNIQTEFDSYLDRRQCNSFELQYSTHLKESARKEQQGVGWQHKPESHRLKQDPIHDEHLFTSLQERMKDVRYQRMQQFRQNLPSYNMREEILKTVAENQVVVISGETGCGKTTQVPQFILDDYILSKRGSLCRIVCTQPRRISAITVAERVSDERAQCCGSNNDVGYQIRVESKMPRQKGSILYCTTGVVLQKMHGDPYFDDMSHIILDEIHERDLDSDFLLIILQEMRHIRPNLKVILMSATLNAEQFSDYFGKCPMLNILGFTHPVKEYLLEDVLEITGYHPSAGHHSHAKHLTAQQRRNKQEEDARRQEEYDRMIVPFLSSLQDRYSPGTIEALRNWDEETIDLDLVAVLLKHICVNEGNGAILVFLPGWDQISKLNNLLMADHMFNSPNFLILPLHSLMPTVNQKAVFNQPPLGVRKIILATNIAETSITIDDVVFVIDTGKVKMSNFDVENNIATLKPEWVALANAKQRRGRAGRVQPGMCYHLYTKLREGQLRQYPLPEMLRTTLETLCLKIKILKLGKIEKFIATAMNPPEPKAVTLAIQLLRTLNALDEDENLTPLGFHLARLPLDPHTGKMILMGAMFSCLDPILTVAASLSFKDAFIIPLGKEQLVDQKRIELARDTRSDHLMLVQAFQGWEEALRYKEDRAYCWENFLSPNTLKMLKDLRLQFTQYLHDLGFLHCSDPKHKDFNQNSGNEQLLKAVICAGLYPNVVKLKGRRKNPRHKRFLNRPSAGYTQEDGKVTLHPRSVNAKQRDFASQWLVYHTKVKTDGVFLHDTTMVHPYSLLFFGGQVCEGQEYGTETVSVDNWIIFRCPARIADLVKELRQQLDRLLEYKVTHPGVSQWSLSTTEGKLLTAIVELVTSDDPLLSVNPEGSDRSYYDEDNDQYSQ